jgi:CubicO group peptidase (beta-lactamase class C family)
MSFQPTATGDSQPVEASETRPGNVGVPRRSFAGQCLAMDHVRVRQGGFDPMTVIRSLAIDAARRHGLGGIAVAVVAKGERPAIECLGLACADGRSVVADTVFRIASISKTLTAIGVMQLRDEGLLGLDDPVNKHLKAFRVEPPPGAPEVTFRHLLTHTAGIGELPRIGDVTSRAAWGSGRPYAPASDLAALYRGVLRTEVPAGSKWAYANHGFAVLGQLVEDIAGGPFAEHMREHVLQPLGMANTDYVRSERVSDALATGYHWMFGRFRPLKDYDLTLLGPGSVLSSVNDMARYAEWLLSGGAGQHGDVLAPTTLREMLSAQFAVDPRVHTKMGLAFFLDQLGSHPVAGHDGNVPGFASGLLIAPDDGVGVVVLTNTSSLIGAHVLAASAMRSLLGVPALADVFPSTIVTPRPHLWPELIGYFAPDPGFLTNVRTWQMTGGEVEVVVRRRRLILRALSPLPELARGLELHAVDDNDPYLFALSTNGLVIPVAFGADATGRVDRVAIGAPANVTLHRRSPWRSSRRRLIAVSAGGLAAVAMKRARR